MAKFKVAIDAGHGGFGVTPGKRTPDGEYEWNFNNKVAVACIAKLKANGVDVIRTDDPTGKTDVGLTARTNKANNAGADIMVSFHHNANTGKWGTWTGTETFTYLGSWPKAEKLAKEVQSRIVKAYGLRDRGLKKENFAIVRQSNMPAILVEGGYMDSTIDIKKLRSDAVLKAAGIAAAEGILAYLGVSSGNSAVIPGDKSEANKPVAGEIYRVRWSWGNVESQKGAFSDLNNAKELADKYPGYKVYNSKGATIYQSKQKTAATGNAYVREAQEFLNSRGYPTKAKFTALTVDGFTGPKSLTAALRVAQYYGGVTIDGVWGPNTKKAMRMLSKADHTTWWTHLLQTALVLKGINVDVDGVFGNGTEDAVERFQASKGLTADGIAGPNTWEKLLG